uniref:Peroxidasin n=1 Tax=Aceria tosichella TaxID=561515 RepID=A0A6G1SPA2_9ACAR
MQAPRESKSLTRSLCIVSIATMAMVIMISLKWAPFGGVLVGAQETFILADHQYESLRNHYSHQRGQPCLVALPAIVIQQHDSAYGPGLAPSRPAVCITEQDVELALEEAAAARGATMSTSGGNHHHHWSAQLQAHHPYTKSVQTSEQPSALEVISSAELVAQASRILAQKFSLSESEILYELPKIDAANSAALARVCPDFLEENAECLADDQPVLEGNLRFRPLSGFCNNVHEKSWGAARSGMVRFLAPDYQDSIWAPRVARDGSPLPSARVISFVLHQDTPDYDSRNSMLGVVWGQFINHDINLGVRVTDEAEQMRDLDCCKRVEDSSTSTASAGYQQQYRQACDCYPIEIPKSDPFYGYFGKKCMNFVRLSPALQPSCSMGPVQAMNKHSSYLDGSSIYGSNTGTLRRLRAYRGGLLRSQPVPTTVPVTITQATPAVSEEGYQGDDGGGSAVIYDSTAGAASAVALAVAASETNQANTHQGYLVLDNDQLLPSPHYSINLSTTTSEPLFKDLLPANDYAPDLGCERRNRPQGLYCFDAGDTRANEQIQLASLHTIMMREHNRLANGLAAINPHWSDERLFQEARKIVGAELQHITYSEFFPLVLGKEALLEYGLQLAPPGQYSLSYDPKINAGVRVEFQAAAFRYGHSLVPGHIERYNKFHQQIESVRLSKLLKQPFDLYFPGVLDTYIMGLADQRSGRMDAAMTTEVANHLFEKPGHFFGLDLAAINIQRARDMGVSGYNSYREFCGLHRAKDFDDLTGTFSNKTLFRMAQVYKHVDDIDLFTGGISEYPRAGALIGPTFSCLIAKQAALLKRGDRFWYENPGQFSLEQLDEIRRHTSARLLCDNSDDLEDIQAKAMLMPDHHTNPRVRCHSLPSIDLSKWREPGGYQKEVYDVRQQQQNLYSATASVATSATAAASVSDTSLGGYASPNPSLPQISEVPLHDTGITAATTTERRPLFRGPLAIPSQGHLTLLVHALQQYQKNQPPYEQHHLHSALKSITHIVDHLVDVSNYRQVRSTH